MDLHGYGTDIGYGTDNGYGTDTDHSRPCAVHCNEEHYKKGTFLALRNTHDYDIGRLEEDYGPEKKNNKIVILWFKKMNKENPLVYEKDRRKKAYISNAILGVAGGQILLEKFHISKRIHKRFLEICKRIPLQGYSGGSPQQKAPTLQKTLSPIPPQGYGENFSMKNTDTSKPRQNYSERSLQHYWEKP